MLSIEFLNDALLFPLTNSVNGILTCFLMHCTAASKCYWMVQHSSEVLLNLQDNNTPEECR